MKMKKQWARQIEINAPIEEVWEFLDGSLENMQRIMSQVVDHKPIRETEEKVGSIHRQKYREGKRVIEYDVKTVQYENTPTKKLLQVAFNLANMFDITAKYELEKIDEQKTLFTQLSQSKNTSKHLI